MSDRHPKWVRVEPGTVIPAGQPHMIEYPDTPGGLVRAEFKGLPDSRIVADGPNDFFVDSSWSPPLVLPTEPTWGIAVRKDFDQTSVLAVGDHWRLNADGQMQGDLCCWSADNVLDFIPLTDEQVARIEAAR